MLHLCSTCLSKLRSSEPERGPGPGRPAHPRSESWLSLAGLDASSPRHPLLLEAAALLCSGPLASRWYEAEAAKQEFLHKDSGRCGERGSLWGLRQVTDSWGWPRLLAYSTQISPGGSEASWWVLDGCWVGIGWACAGEQPTEAATRATSRNNPAGSQGISSLEWR